MSRVANFAWTFEWKHRTSVTYFIWAGPSRPCLYGWVISHSSDIWGLLWKSMRSASGSCNVPLHWTGNPSLSSGWSGKASSWERQSGLDLGLWTLKANALLGSWLKTNWKEPKLQQLQQEWSRGTLCVWRQHGVWLGRGRRGGISIWRLIDQSQEEFITEMQGDMYCGNCLYNLY